MTDRNITRELWKQFFDYIWDQEYEQGKIDGKKEIVELITESMKGEKDDKSGDI